MLYLDTSLLVSAFSVEARTAQIQDWLGAQNPEELAISEWVIAEFSSALSLKIRTGQMDLSQRSAAKASLAGLLAVSIEVLAISREHYQAAARYADQFALGLRAADALHLAVAVEYGATLCTLDRTLASAGEAVGASMALI